MSSTIIGDVMAVKLTNGKILPFVLSAASNVRSFNNSLVWVWHNIYVGNHNNFMFDSAMQLQDTMNKWEEGGCMKYLNGRFIKAHGMNIRLICAFSNPLHIKKGMFLLTYIKLSDDRKNAERISYIPKSENDFLTYMEANKEHSISILIPKEVDL